MIANGQSLQVSWNRSRGRTSYRLEVGTGSGLSDLVNADVGDVDRVRDAWCHPAPTSSGCAP